MHATNHVDRSMLASVNTSYCVKLLIVSSYPANTHEIQEFSTECVSTVYNIIACPVLEVFPQMYVLGIQAFFQTLLAGNVSKERFG